MENLGLFPLWWQSLWDRCAADPPNESTPLKIEKGDFMADTEATAEDVVELVRKAVPQSACADKCHKQYLRDLAKCKGDRDCVAKATGHYVLCVLSCRGK